MSPSGDRRGHQNTTKTTQLDNLNNINSKTLGMCKDRLRWRCQLILYCINIYEKEFQRPDTHYTTSRLIRFQFNQHSFNHSHSKDVNSNLDRCHLRHNSSTPRTTHRRHSTTKEWRQNSTSQVHRKPYNQHHPTTQVKGNIPNHKKAVAV